MRVLATAQSLASTRAPLRELTGPNWSGLPLCAAQLEGSGRASGLVTSTDTVMVWSGGRSEVTVDHGRAGAASTRLRFCRQSGMIDLLPGGTVIEHVEWHGQRSSCVAALVPPAHAALQAEAAVALAPDTPPRFGLIDSHVVDLVRRLETQAVRGEPLGTPYTEALSLTLVTYLARRYGKLSEGDEERGALTPAQRQQVIDFVEGNLHADVGQAGLAGLTSYSTDHFSRLFKRAFGEPPYQYVLRRRVERAKSMLRDPSRSLADIATACGFSTQAHLNSVFKRRTGLTPGAYRRG